jgi:transcriptional regulator of arginine metabolism
MRARRQAVLRDLVADGRVGSQADAVVQLAAVGITATQATVSRDLEALGAARVRTAEGVRYALPDAPSAFGAPLKVVLRDYVVSGEASGPLAVLRTPPGHASVVAAALDRAQLDGVLGTVAGDDTLFVCGDDRTGGAGVLALLELPGPTATSPRHRTPRSTRERT